MTYDKPHILAGKPYTQKEKPVPPGLKPKPAPDVAALRAEVEVMPVPRSLVSSGTVTKRMSVTTTGGDDDGDIKEIFKPHAPQLAMELVALALEKSTTVKDKIAIINSVLDRVYGKPGQVIQKTETVADLTSLHLAAVRDAGKSSSK